MNVASLLTRALAFIFPPRKDESVVEGLNTVLFCELLTPENKNGVITLLPYSHTDVRSVLWEAKFHRNIKAISLLGHALSEFLEQEEDACVLIPIPLAPKRMRERGYNQCELIAREATSIIKHGEVISALQKIHETPPQTSLKKSERMTNVEGAFEVVYPEKLVGKKILIIDDVTTTGSTLREARRAFANAGLSVTCIALTRAGSQ